MDKYIEWDLENNPQFFTEPHSGKFVDVDVIRHVVCNVNRTDGVPDEEFKRVLNAVAEEVDMIPPATDVAPVVHAEWEIDEFGRKCSACKEYIPDDFAPSEYCPHCGAKMDGGIDNAE